MRRSSRTRASIVRVLGGSLQLSAKERCGFGKLRPDRSESAKDMVTGRSWAGTRERNARVERTGLEGAERRSRFGEEVLGQREHLEKRRRR